MAAVVARLTASATELTTAGSDALLGVVCVVLLWRLLDVPPGWQRSIWIGVLALMAAASFLGAVAHGLVLTDRVRAALWQPLYLSLGLTIALFVVAAVCDWKGVTVARSVLPWMLIIGVAFYGVTLLLQGAFRVFIAYEAVAMIAALAIYGMLWSQGVPGAGLIAAGIGVSIVAAVVQATPARLTLGVPFDHNGLFHLIQIAGILLLSSGVRARLLAAIPS